jgi:HTH-type transcriptional regulator, competence development regulator
MTIEITKEWCRRMAQLEGGFEVGAGLTALDPTFDGAPATQAQSLGEANVAFGRFVRLMRRSKGLTVERLAGEADVDVAELVEVEEDAHYKPEVRTVYQLANYFRLPRSSLLQVAGLAAPRDEKLLDEAVRFAARAEPVTQLTPEERAALEAFVSVLSERTSSGRTK